MGERDGSGLATSFRHRAGSLRAQTDGRTTYSPTPGKGRCFSQLLRGRRKQGSARDGCQHRRDEGSQTGHRRQRGDGPNPSTERDPTCEKTTLKVQGQGPCPVRSEPLTAEEAGAARARRSSPRPPLAPAQLLVAPPRPISRFSRCGARMRAEKASPEPWCRQLGRSAHTTRSGKTLGPVESGGRAVISPVAEAPREMEMLGGEQALGPLSHEGGLVGGTAQDLCRLKAKGNRGIEPAHTSHPSWDTRTSCTAQAACWNGLIIIRAGP